MLAALFSSLARSAVRGITICGVTVKSEMKNEMISKRRSEEVIARGMERRPVRMMRSRMRERRRRRSPRGEMRRIPMA